MRWLPIKLIQCRFSSGQRVPLLVQAGNAAPLPVLTPFIYVQRNRHLAYNTAAAHLRAIQAFYSYAESQDLDIDEAILACRFVTPFGSKVAVKPIIWSPELARLQRHLFRRSIRAPVISTCDC